MRGKAGRIGWDGMAHALWFQDWEKDHPRPPLMDLEAAMKSVRLDLSHAPRHGWPQYRSWQKDEAPQRKKYAKVTAAGDGRSYAQARDRGGFGDTKDFLRKVRGKGHGAFAPPDDPAAEDLLDRNGVRRA